MMVVRMMMVMVSQMMLTRGMRMLDDDQQAPPGVVNCAVSDPIWISDPSRGSPKPKCITLGGVSYQPYNPHSPL